MVGTLASRQFLMTAGRWQGLALIQLQSHTTDAKVANNFLIIYNISSWGDIRKSFRLSYQFSIFFLQI